MTVAIAKVHGANGVWGQNGGYELPLVMTTALFAITAAGPGAMSVDRRSWGTPWALAAIASGVAGGFAMMELSKRTPEPEPGAGDQPTASRSPSPSAQRIERSLSASACAALSRVTKLGPVATTSRCAGRIPYRARMASISTGM